LYTHTHTHTPSVLNGIFLDHSNADVLVQCHLFVCVCVCVCVFVCVVCECVYVYVYVCIYICIMCTGYKDALGSFQCASELPLLFARQFSISSSSQIVVVSCY